MYINVDTRTKFITHNRGLFVPPLLKIRKIPKKNQQSVLNIITELRTSYSKLILLVIGDFQHTVLDNSLHRIGRPQPPPPTNILTPCLHYPLYLVSVALTQHPNNTYHTWLGKTLKGRAGLDHILAAQEHIRPAYFSGIDHKISSSYHKSDHRLIYASFVLS